MIMKFLLLFLLCFSYSFGVDEVEQRLFVEYHVDGDFDEVVYYLKDEMLSHGFVLSYSSDIAKMANGTAEFYKTKPLFIKAQKIGFCKKSLGYALLRDNRKYIAYCPISVALYEIAPKKITILYKLAQKIDVKDRSVDDLNELLSSLLKNIAKDF